MAGESTSKEISDFAEHVRTVQFALLVTCLALFAASLPEAPEDLHTAKRDLTRIQAAATSKTLDRLINRAFVLAARGPGEWRAKEAGTYGFKATYRFNESTFGVIVTPAWRTTLTLEEQAIPAFAAERGMVLTCGAALRADLQLGEFRVSIDPSNSLADFVAFWDCLPRIRAVRLGRTHSEKAAPIALDETLAATFKNNLVSVSAFKADSRNVVDELDPPPFRALYLTLRDGHMVLEFDPNKQLPSSPADVGATPVLHVSGSRAPGVRPAAAALAPSSAETVFTMPFIVPADTRGMSTKAQQMLIDEYFKGEATGPFDLRFPQLAAWARGRAARTPQILLEDLEQDIERASESFELFGVKIPLSLIAKVGLLVLVAIEGYFYLHLRRLTAIIQGTTPLPKFPWIGAYTDAVSMTASVASSALLPMAVVAWLAVTTWGKLSVTTALPLGIAYVVTQTLLIRQMIAFRTALRRAESMKPIRRVKVPTRPAHRRRP
jgi:hypothetical protein